MKPLQYLCFQSGLFLIVLLMTLIRFRLKLKRSVTTINLYISFKHTDNDIWQLFRNWY